MAGRPAQAQRQLTIDSRSTAPTGAFVDLDGEAFYRIATYQRLDPFLMTLASDTDLWMFVASGGGLAAGRVDAEGSLFPYDTSDQLHDSHHHTGPFTLIRFDDEDGSSRVWEPFADAGDEKPSIERNLYKNLLGNRLVFEEVDHDLGLAFRYRWAGCDEFGWVRSATLENRTTATVRLALLDGLRNVLPWGAPLSLYQQSSNLVDAYKKSEVDPESGLGIFSLTAGITDRAEALEVLRANTVWCTGLDDFRVHLSPAAAIAFRQGRVITDEHVLDGARGNYLVSSNVEMEPGQSCRWHLAADVGRDHIQISELRQRLIHDPSIDGHVAAGLRRSSEDLRHIVASADGLQLTGRPESWWHHFANVLFNCMRGGVFAHDHDVPIADFVEFVQVRNTAAGDRHQTRLVAWPATMTVQALIEAVRETEDPDLERLAHEYLPLYFGRRHGDPSRPWNRFSIRVRDGEGQRALNYEGNWRDIFQNWEALSTAFPGFLPSLVAKFVNASTVDGFNPYRITRDGVDWETVSPDDPWSNIGYWGDHQIIYLLKLLEAMDGHDPDILGDLLGAEIFSYAEVPYLLKPYADLLKNPGATIDFDTARAARIADRVAREGSDGKLLHGADGSVYHANLLEKLLVPALSKLSNLIPDGGIWMNTQRPEWNDANNALAGGGVSVVTLCYLRRYLAFLVDCLDGLGARDLPVSTEVAVWFDGIASALEGAADLIDSDGFDARSRMHLLDDLQASFESYRTTAYDGGFSGRRDLATNRVADLCRTALTVVDHGIAANRRDDGLYHSYNLLEISDDGSELGVGRLQVMLEGQVAVLSSGALDPAGALEILELLFASDLYRSDQSSFLLYPERELPGFLTKNAVPEERVASIPLLQKLLAAGDRALLARDKDGICRFQGDLKDRRDLEPVFDRLAQHDQWTGAVARDRSAVLDLFEDVFRHRSYTGRSGIMYGYEGLGCIYWHMVAKLLLAVQENALRAERDGLSAPVREGLARMYYRVRAGIGYEKTVAEYGAFPTDPYSHTPASGGAKQPGLTGQVKEEILTRLGELGVHVESGAVRFEPALLEPDEFLEGPDEFQYLDRDGNPGSIPLRAGSLAFTFCQVPVVYEQTADEVWIRITFADGSTTVQSGGALDVSTSAELLARSGRIARIHVGLATNSRSEG